MTSDPNESVFLAGGKPFGSTEAPKIGPDPRRRLAYFSLKELTTIYGTWGVQWWTNVRILKNTKMLQN